MIRISCLLIALAASTASAVDLSFDPRPATPPRAAKSRQRSAIRQPTRMAAQQVWYQAPEEIANPAGEDLQWDGHSQPPMQETSAADPDFPVMEGPLEGDSLMPMPMIGQGHFDDMSDQLEPPAPTLSSGRWFNRGCWYAQEDVTYLVRATRRHQPLATDVSNISPIGGNRHHLRTSTGLNFAPGARITLGRFLGRDPMNRDSSVEFTFMGLNDWFFSQGLQSVDPDALITPFDPGLNLPGFDFTNFQQYQYTSKFNSYELNFRIARRLDRDRLTLTRDGTWVRTVTPHLLPTIFAGLRLVTLNEEFNWTATAVDPTQNSGQYNVRTYNNLFGVQFGSDITYQQSNWRVLFRVKAGPMVNWASEVTNVQTTFLDVFSVRDSSANRNTLAFVGEFNLMGVYLFRPNMGLRASYDFIGMSNVALADKQVTFYQLNPPFFTTSHGTYIQGVSFGFECYW